MYDQYRDRGFVVIQALAENGSSGTPTQEDLQSWADQYGLDFPVVADSGWAVNNRFEQDFGIPTWVLIGPGAEVLAVDDHQGAQSMLESALPN